MRKGWIGHVVEPFVGGGAEETRPFVIFRKEAYRLMGTTRERTASECIDAAKRRIVRSTSTFR
jgi:hypothetical protein